MHEGLGAVLVGLDLDGLQVVVDEREARERDAAPGVTVHLADALRLALEAFLGLGPAGGQPSHETPTRVVRDVPDACGLAADPPPDAVTAVIRGWLTTDPGARVVLLTPATLAMEPYRFPPEDGEDPAALWVFRVVTPQAYPGLWWAIVDPAGERPAYAYGYA